MFLKTVVPHGEVEKQTEIPMAYVYALLNVCVDEVGYTNQETKAHGIVGQVNLRSDQTLETDGLPKVHRPRRRVRHGGEQCCCRPVSMPDGVFLNTQILSQGMVQKKRSLGKAGWSARSSSRLNVLCL